MISAPRTEDELLKYADTIAGKTLSDLGKSLNIDIPEHFKTNKGWLGQLLEKALGATAGSKAAPDFEKINVELKTLPLSANHTPKESTFVCTANAPFASHWHSSLVWKKLQRVLWVPIEANPNIKIAERRIGQAILWSPSQEQETVLQQDWQELTELLSLGHYDQLTAKHGTYLQCRPKAANASVLKKDVDANGKSTLITPRGFYLRTCFTNRLLVE
jgi:DNA mismatch repair protein MutH